MTMTPNDDVKVPNNHVIAVLTGRAAAEAAADEIERRSFVCTMLFTGHELEEKVDAKGEHSGLIRRIFRSVEDHLSEQTNYLAQYEEEAKQGNEVLAVQVEDHEQAAEVSVILEKHGARNVRFFGRLAVADLTPTTNPSAHSAESPEKDRSGT